MKNLFVWLNCGDFRQVTIDHVMKLNVKLKYTILGALH